MHIEHLIKQKSYEKPAYILRRHAFIFLKDIALFVLLAAIPYALFRVVFDMYPWLLAHTLAYPVIVLVASLYYLSIWLFFFGHFLDYYLDLWIVTNDRIMNIEQQGLFGRTIAELDLWKIQDVTSEVKGMVPTFLNYGNVFIQTAGEQKRFVFEQVPNPHEIRKRIVDLIEDDRKFHLKDVQMLQGGV